MSDNLCFERDPQRICDIMNETNEDKDREAIIGITKILREHEYDYRVISQRIDRIELEIKEIKELLQKTDNI
jgi:hypothetical protein